MDESGRGAARPVFRRTSMDVARAEPVAPRLHFSRRRRVPKRAPFTHLDGVERGQPRIIGGITQPGARPRSPPGSHGAAFERRREPAAAAFTALSSRLDEGWIPGIEPRA
jgi:hypothetical protein